MYKATLQLFPNINLPRTLKGEVLETSGRERKGTEGAVVLSLKNVLKFRQGMSVCLSFPFTLFLSFFHEPHCLAGYTDSLEWKERLCILASVPSYRLSLYHSPAVWSERSLTTSLNLSFLCEVGVMTAAVSFCARHAGSAWKI